MARIKDVALKAGVASSTVSRVLNNDPSISIKKEKRDKILAIADELGYLTPTMRKSCVHDEDHFISRTQSKNNPYSEMNIVVIHFLNPTEELNDPYFTSVRIGIEKQCHLYNIALRNTFVANITSSSHFIHQAHAVICVGHFSSQDIDNIFRLNKNLIFVDSDPRERNCDSVLFDREEAAAAVVSRIIESGASRPAFIGNDESRLHVFTNMTKQAGIFHEDLCIVSNVFCIESGYKAMSDMLCQKIQPDVVFAATDIIAIGVYRAIQERQIDIPKDIQVIGMNDIPAAQHLNPSLSTLRLFPVEMGEAAVDLARERASGRTYRKKVMLDYEMVLRESFK
ncbi:LacI family DNA-binding transcriptional regulator [Vibrio alfacsensis]|uniref:LacI family DNA-binding transcriptional regulator n=1 Tax=Vibrio alfacsensis TaxID=1074311 RepID=UPI001BF0C2F3|nr:LacI family DNA-binding transcriptional regulator [Vibrio alfacsensis]BCN24588.1 LacI family transcriptional regulator [Vibrio alfacsensis]